MKTIFKYALPMDGWVEMHRGAYPLTVQMQGDAPYIWAFVESEHPLEKRQFLIFGTGHPMPTDPGTYLGTIQMMHGQLVFHVFKGESSK